MFAPHCPSCRRRVLLSTDQLVRISWQDGERTAVLRCFCGALVDWDQRPPAVTAAEGTGAPAEADSEDRRFVEAGAIADRLSLVEGREPGRSAICCCVTRPL